MPYLLPSLSAQEHAAFDRSRDQRGQLTAYRPVCSHELLLQTERARVVSGPQALVIIRVRVAAHLFR